MADGPVLHGLLAEFDAPGALLRAAAAVREAGYTRWDTHAPYPVHGLPAAMGLPRSRVPWVAAALALAGLGGVLSVQYFTSVLDYPLVASGKPTLGWPAWLPVAAAVTILCGVVGAVLGFLHQSRLPRHHHPLFHSTRFERSTDDRFFLSVEAVDPRYDEARTAALLRGLGATHLERVEE